MDIEEIQQRIINADQLHISGSTNQASPTANNILNMSEYAGLIEYHPEELVMIVKAGTSIKEISQVLAQNGQILPFSVQSNNESSIGSAYAIGSPELSDAILGIKIIDGQGRLLTFGGQVMKNVAGYDVSRLLVGSKGRYSVICEISFKVLPDAYATQNSKQKGITGIQNASEVRTRIEQGLKAIFDPRAVFI